MSQDLKTFSGRRASQNAAELHALSNVGPKTASFDGFDGWSAHAEFGGNDAADNLCRQFLSDYPHFVFVENRATMGRSAKNDSSAFGIHVHNIVFTGSRKYVPRIAAYGRVALMETAQLAKWLASLCLMHDSVGSRFLSIPNEATIIALVNWTCPVPAIIWTKDVNPSQHSAKRRAINQTLLFVYCGSTSLAEEYSRLCHG